MNDIEGFNEAIQETADRMLVIMSAIYAVEVKRKMLAGVLGSLLAKAHEEISILHETVFELTKIVDVEHVLKARDIMDKYANKCGEVNK